MLTRRISTAALLLALLGAACGGSQAATDSDASVLGLVIERTTTTTTTASTTTTSTLPPPVAEPVADVAPAKPAAKPAPAEAPQPTVAAITVNYVGLYADTTDAVLEETGAKQSLASGSTEFGDLAPGTYTVHVEVVFPDDTGQTVPRAYPVLLNAGDHAVITCDDTECWGVLGT